VKQRLGTVAVVANPAGVFLFASTIPTREREEKKQKIADSVVMFGQMIACTDTKERAQAGDLLLLSLPRERVVEMISKQERGIRVRSLHASQALSEQSEFVELVLSSNSPLLGQPICTLDYKLERLVG